MSPEILKEVTRQYLGLNFEVSCFSWQGGEPTLCGLSFFRKAIELQKKYGRSGQRVSNAFQTNGLLINKEWCSFFSEYKFLVGLSLDGPRKIHDYYRTKGHNGTWKTVMRTAKLLAECEVRVFGSRIAGVAKKYSDFDLIIIGNEKITRKVMVGLKEAFEESKLPFRVDVLDWHAISESFRKVIKAQYEVIQKRGSGGIKE